MREIMIITTYPTLLGLSTDLIYILVQNSNNAVNASEASEKEGLKQVCC